MLVMQLKKQKTQKKCVIKLSKSKFKKCLEANQLENKIN